MNTDIEEIRLLSLEVAEQFHDRSVIILEHHANFNINRPHMIALVYAHVFELLNADQDISVSTRAKFLKSLAAKFTKNLFDMDLYVSAPIPVNQRVEKMVHQVWAHLDESYTAMIVIGVPNLHVEVQSPAQRIKDAREHHTETPVSKQKMAP